MLCGVCAGDQRLQADHGGDGVGDAGRGATGGLAGGGSVPESREKTRAGGERVWAYTISATIFGTIVNSYDVYMT